ncbi:MAG: SGNH/GDSL hydrolase family protein [Actinomycetota bacterium]
MSHRPTRAVLALAFVLALLLAACGSTSDEADTGAAEGPDTTAGAEPDEPAPDRTIVALGDSIFAWNDSESIPDVIGATLDRPVINASVSGAHFDLPDGAEEAADDGLDIRRQYDALGQTGFDWVVLDGGGNDVNDSCGCGQCSEVLDAMVSSDGTSGSIPEFVTRVVADGSTVMFVGYYELPAEAEGFGDCGDELQEQSTRLALMAAGIDGVHFVSAADVVTASNTAAYDEDLVHPSPEGSRIVGEYVAEAILAAE